MKRVFFALTMDDLVKNELGKLEDQINPLIKKGRFVRPSLFHLTLQFLGELEEAAVLQLKNMEYPWLNHFNTIKLEINQLGCFQKRNRWILWAGIKENTMLFELSNFLNVSMENLGYENNHPFRPHITLAREVQFHHHDGPMALETMDIKMPPAIADGFHLMESTRVEGKLHYVSLKKYPFGRRA